MTEPVIPQGKFTAETDVTSRFEGSIPSGRLPWVRQRILDVEYELMGRVPSLRVLSVQDIQAADTAAGDPDRLKRVTRLVAEKVLDLYRNPGGPMTQKAITTPDITTSKAWSPDPTRGRVEFTDSELDGVRLRKRKRRFGTIAVAPFMPTRPRRCW